MSKSLAIISLLTISAIAAQNASAACSVVGHASIRGRPEFQPSNPGSNAATSEQTWGDTETLRYTGSELGSPANVNNEGSNKAFHGPVQPGFTVYGPYASVQGSLTSIRAHMRTSIAWAPDGREVCTNHRTKPNGARVCTAKGIEYFPTSFVVDITTNVGTVVHYSTQFSNVNSLGDTFIDMPELVCDGNIDQFEMRIYGLTGGSVDFTVHELVLDTAWKY